MKKVLLVIFSVIIWVSLFTSVNGDAYYDIQNYDVNVVVNEDNTYDVIETITVVFKEPRHGIYRDIPYKYYGYVHKIDNIQVYNPDTWEAYKIKKSRSNGNISIRIGNPNKYVDGVVTYAISYTYDMGYDYMDNQDEFYFNLIGNEWDANIEGGTFRVEMPKTFEASDVSITTGYKGEENHSIVEYAIHGDIIEGHLISPLYAYQGLTVALPLEEGYFQNVSGPPSVLPIQILVGLMFIISLVALYYNRRYKNENTIVPVTVFAPPEELNAAEVAYIYKREKVSNSDLSTLVLEWAAKGYLTIEDKSKKIGPFKASQMEFVKIKDLDTSHPAYESSLFNSFFKHGKNNKVTTKDLREKYYINLQSAAKKLKSRFLFEKEILVNEVQKRTALISIAFMIFYALFLGYTINQKTGEGFGLGFSFAFGIILVALMIRMIIKSIIMKQNKLVSKVVAVFFILIFFGGFFLILIDVSKSFLASFEFSLGNPILLIGLMTLLILFSILWISSIKEYTTYGKDMVGKVEGFRNFLSTSKKDQMEMLFEQNPNYFYDILPYAMVLGLTHIWEKHVEAIGIQQPDWYTSQHGFHAATFATAMSQSLAATTSSPSSSSSSGGSSGGGGGGGGGGSW